MHIEEYKKEVSSINKEINSISYQRVHKIRDLISTNISEITSIVMDDSIALINRNGDLIKTHDNTDDIYLFSNVSFSNVSDDFYLTITGDIISHTNFDDDTGLFDDDIELFDEIERPYTTVDDKLLSILLSTNENYLDTLHIVSISPLLEKSLESKKNILNELKSTN